MIRVVTFDVGGTLIRPYPSVGAIYATAGQRFGLRAAPARLDEAFRNAWERRDRSGRNRPDGREWWRTLVFQVLDEVGFHGARVPCFDACYEAFAHARAWRVFDDVRPTLERLHAMEISLGLISNWDERLPGLLEELELARYFDWLLVSAVEGIQKPDLRLFERACRLAARPATEILHVGDDPEEDLRAARDAGMAGVLVDRAGRHGGQESVRHLGAIVGRVRPDLPAR